MEMQIFHKKTKELIAWFSDDNIVVNDEYDIRVGEELKVRGEQDEIYRDVKNNGKREKVYIAGKGKKLQSKPLRRLFPGNGR